MSQKLPISINEQEFTKIIKNTKKQKYKVAFLLGFAAGLRVSEVINLRKSDIDIKGKKILIRQGKGSKDRIVPLPKGFRIKFMKEIPIDLSCRSLQRNFKEILNLAGIKREDLTFHSLRHGFATHGLEAGIPLNQMQLLLGHESIRSTNIYVRANPKQALKSYEEFF